MKSIISALSMGFLALSIVSCEEIISIPDDVSGITLKSTDVIVEYDAAKVYGDIRVSHNPERIKEVRVLYGSAPDALSKNVKATYDTKNGFSAAITSLEDGAQFFYRVDILVGKTSIEGEVKDFVTFPKGPIDLDLPSGKKWASHNVGAELPTDTGGYYAWGEVTEKTQYDWTSYSHCKGAYNKLTRYTLSKYYSYDGTVDNLVELIPEDDVARKVLGEHYSIPSYKDWQELMENCVLSWAKINGVYGCRVSSKKDMNNNKKFIFLSGNDGYFSGTGKQSTSFSYYWTSTLNTSFEELARSVQVSFFSPYVQDSNGNRYLGESIRAVYE